MSRKWGVVLVILMLLLSVLFLNWSGLVRLPSFVGSFPHVKSLYLNRLGNKELKAQNYQNAFDTYVKTLEKDPFAAEIHLNLGLTFEGQQQPEKALPSYENALKFAKNEETRFMALFNKAQLLGKAKKVDEALDLYQKSLEIDPTSKETKTNIELLIQSQQQQGKDGDNKDQPNQQDPKQDPQDSKDQKDKDGKDPKDSQDPKDNKESGKDDKEKKDKDENKKYAPNQKPQPRPFKGQELSEGDVKKILGEIKQQEQKIRSEYNRKEVKEQARDKDW